MAFSVPTFPITCNIFRGPWTARVLASTPPCNLAQGRRIMLPEEALSIAAVGADNVSQLLLPPLTDIRDLSCAIVADVIECPASSGRWYGVVSVDDFGKGFPNEHRYAFMVKIYEQVDPVLYPGLFWPVPIP